MRDNSLINWSDSATDPKINCNFKIFKSKNIKKMIIKGLKVHESLNEIECMLKYLEKLQILWKFNEEIYNCHIGVFLKLVFVLKEYFT